MPTASSAPVATFVHPKSTTNTTKAKTGAILAGVIGGLAVLIGIAICARRKRQSKNAHVQPTRKLKRSQLPDFSTENTHSSEISQDGGAVYSISRDGPDQVGGRHGRSIVANTTLPPDTRKTDHTDSSERLGPEMSITTMDMPPSLSQTPNQPNQEDNQLRPIDDLSKTQQLTPIQVNSPSGALPDQRVSLIIQEVNELRAQMAVMQRQQLEASRESRLSHLAPSEGDDSRTAPPSYSDGGF